MNAAPQVKLLSALGLALVFSAWGLPESPVADAAMRGDAESVRRLVREGADVNAAQGDGMSALHWAAERGDAQMAELLIYAGANVRAGTRIGSYTPLHLASKAGSAPVVVALLKAGSDVNATTTNSGATALHLAAGAGSVETITALVDAGADVNARDKEWGQTPLMHAAGWNRPAAVTALLARHADPNLTSTAIDVARMAAVDQMAERRKQAVLDGFRPASASAAEWQPTTGQLEAAVREARAIQLANSADRKYQDGKLEDDQAAEYPLRVGAWGGLTALLHAVRQGYRETTIALLDGGADINEVSAGDHTSPLLMATVNGQFDLSMLLIERGADVNLASDAGAAPLYATLERQWAPKSRYPQPQEYEQQDAQYLDVMKALLDAGADPDARLTTHLWYMEYTFEHLRVDTKGATPFWRAAYGTDVPAMRLLTDYGANPNLATIKLGEATFVFDDYKGEDGSGLPPVPPGGPAVYAIHAASGAGYGEGFAANHHRHAADGWLPSMQYLVGELGMDPNLRDQNGYTALHHAAARGDNATIEYLVSKGGDVTLVSRRGQTTADMANGPYQRIQPFPTTVALLEKLGSKNNHRCMSC